MHFDFLSLLRVSVCRAPESGAVPVQYLVAVDLRDERRVGGPVLEALPLSTATLPLLILLIPLLVPTVVLTVKLVDATGHVLNVLRLILQAAVVVVRLHTGLDLTANGGS